MKVENRSRLDWQSAKACSERWILLSIGPRTLLTLLAFFPFPPLRFTGRTSGRIIGCYQSASTGVGR